jgi:hypothetical protein
MTHELETLGEGMTRMKIDGGGLIVAGAMVRTRA